MNYKELKEIYLKSPFIIKKIYGFIPWEIRMGKSYRTTYKFLLESEYWSKEHWHEYQTKALRKLLLYCAKEIPYYRRLFSEYGIDIQCSDIWKEFYKIPFLDKKILIVHNSELIPQGKQKSLFSLTTGGTTGKPVRIFYDKTSYKKEWAFKIFFWNKALGYKPTDKKITFRGVSFGDTLYYNNPIYNEIRISPFKLETDAIKEIVKLVKQYSPKYIHGYPSALEQFAKFLNTKNELINNIKGIILISENVFERQVKLLKKTFNCPIYSFYGLSERVIMASMDKACNIFYAHPAYGITELIDQKGNIITNKRTMGELVGTGFINEGMPLLRYRTGDFASWENISDSGWNMPALGKIKGRWNQEFLVGKDMSKISLTSLNMHSDIYEKISKLQFFQDTPGVVQLNIVKDYGYTKIDQENIRSQLMEKLGPQFILKFHYLDSLPLTQAGKSKYLIQKLKI